MPTKRYIATRRTKSGQITIGNLAYSAGLDAGNRSMREGGRTRWNVRDWNVACETYEKVMGKEKETLTQAFASNKM